MEERVSAVEQTGEWRHDELGWLPAPVSGEDVASIAESVWREIARGDDPQAALGAALIYGNVPPVIAPTPAPAQAPTAANEIGLDTSSWQGQPDWVQIAGTGRTFAYIKASEGNGSSYASLDGQYAGARAAGLHVGLYHFADPSLTPEANADAFAVQVTRLGAVQGHLPPCLDLETGAGDLSGWAKAFVDRLRAQTGCVRVMVYSSASFFQTHITETWMDPNIALWIAHFGAPPGRPMYLTPRVAIHQYSATGQVTGVTGNVDLNYCIWTLNKLIPSEVELDARQDAMLTACYQQLSGSPNVGEWPGWPTWIGGSNQSLTLIDYARQANVDIETLKVEVAALQAAHTATPAAGAPAALSDTDIARIAAAIAPAVAHALASRLAA